MPTHPVSLIEHLFECSCVGRTFPTAGCRRRVRLCGTTIIGTSRTRSIFAAVEPRNSRLGALSLLDPTMIRSPSRQSSLLTASSTVEPSTTVDVTGMSSGRASFAVSSVCWAWASARSRTASPSPRSDPNVGSRATSDASRNGVPAALLNRTAVRSNRSAPCRSPIAHVTSRTRSTSESRVPRGATATGTGDECSSSLTTEPSE